MLKIGFVGLGHMGLPMANNLIKAGHIVTGYDLQTDALTALKNAGGKVANDLKDIAQDQDVIIAMLQTGDQVQKVCFGEHGLFAHAEKNTLFIDCSSIAVQSSLEIHKQATQAGLIAVDAPVSGGVTSAIAATLTFIVGGTDTAFAKAQPILATMGKNIFHTGDAGTGQAAKICNNMILGISMIGVSEAFTLAEQLGLDAKKFFEVVSHASGRCWVTENYMPVPGILENVPANHDYQPGFTTAMMLKDLKLSQHSAESVALKTPMGALATTLYQQLNDDGMAQLDFSAIIKLVGGTSS